MQLLLKLALPRANRVITLKSLVSRLCNKGASCGSMLCSLTEGRSAHFQ